MAPRRRGHLFAGTSGYDYDHWRGRWYPEGLAREERFAHYADAFDTVEINNTFYRLPAPSTFRTWGDRAPAGFRYALKFSRYGSHMKKLKDPRRAMGPFVRRARRLGRSLGPVLVQLPPGWRADAGRLDAFLAAADDGIRWAVEFRDESWLVDEVFEALERHGAALCIHDKIEDHPREITADWTYLRYHGDRYGGTYSSQKLSAEARRIGEDLKAGRDVYAYFNNDLGGHAVFNARDLRRYATGS